MSSPPSTANTQLPFDILGVIFHHYACEETIRHPVETLLIVCRSWNVAALGHRALWNDLRIYLGHSPTSAIWRTRLPLRIARAGPALPLFISLYNVLDIEDQEDVPECVEEDQLYSDCFCTEQFPSSLVVWPDHCPCYKDARDCAEFALECLAGNNGELCARWKEFHVDLGSGPEYDASRCLARALSYPAPSLTSLLVSNLVLDDVEDEDLTPLLQAPRLQELVAKDCYLLQPPNFQTLLEVELNGLNVSDLGGCSKLQGASQLQIICLRHISTDGVILPATIPNLYSIEIIGGEFPITLHSCQMPELSSVALDFEDYSPILDICACTGIDLKTLQKLSLIWTAPPLYAPIWAEAHEDMMGALHALLIRTPNLSYVSGSQEIVNIFLKILWDSWSEHGDEGILRFKRFSLHFIVDDGSRNPNGGFKVMFTGDDCPGNLVMLAKQWGLSSPDLPIAEFLNLPNVEIPDAGTGQRDA